MADGRIFLLAVLAWLRLAEAQRVLYGLPPLPEEQNAATTTTTAKPVTHNMFSHMLAFTLPTPMSTLPPLRPFDPYNVNPIPELPPVPESRLAGKYDNDGDFVPDHKEEPVHQVTENRIHGVKTEPTSPATAPFLFRTQRDDPPKAYSRARGVEVVTVAPQHIPPPTQSGSRSRETDSDESDFSLLQSGGTQSVKRWQTTATKLSSHQMDSSHAAASLPNQQDDELYAYDEAINGASEDVPSPQEELKKPTSPVAYAVTNVQTAPVHGGLNGVTQRPFQQRRRNIQTTQITMPALGAHAAGTSTLSPQGQRPRRLNNNNNKNHRHNGHRRQGPLQRRRFFDFKPKERTFQPEQKLVTRPHQQQQFQQPQQQPQQFQRPPQFQPQAVPQQQVAPAQQPVAQPIYLTTLPPQPAGRLPQDAAFLSEIEEYDWRLYYKQQQYEQQHAPVASGIQGFTRAQGEPLAQGTPRDSDYEDLLAIRNREHFTDNPPQKNFPLPTSTEASEVLIPFNNPRGELNSAHLNGPESNTGAVNTNYNTNGNNGNTGGNYNYNANNNGGANTNYNTNNFNQGYNTNANGYNRGFNNNFANTNNNNNNGFGTHPLFSGLYNLFNFNGQQGGGGLGALFPGLGR